MFHKTAAWNYPLRGSFFVEKKSPFTKRAGSKMSISKMRSITVKN